MRKAPASAGTKIIAKERGCTDPLPSARETATLGKKHTSWNLPARRINGRSPGLPSLWELGGQRRRYGNELTPPPPPLAG